MKPLFFSAFFLAMGLLAVPVSSAAIDWRESTPTPEPRSGYAAGVIAGRLLLIGGTYWEGEKGNWTKKVFSASTHAFDPVTQTWDKLTDAPVTLGYPAFTQIGDEIYVISGIQNGEPNAAVYTLRMSGSRLQWRRHGWLPEPRVFAGAVTVGPTIYVIGGTRKFEPFDTKGTCCTSKTASKTAWSLDTSTASPSWKRLADIPGHLRWGERAVTDGSAIYVFGGGYQAEQKDPVQSFNEVLRYDPATDRWARLGDMPKEMQGAAPVYAQGKIVLVGPAHHVMTFDPKTAKFASVDPLPEDANVDHFALVGSVLVGASGECAAEGPRRRSEWTFVGRLR